MGVYGHAYGYADRVLNASARLSIIRCQQYETNRVSPITPEVDLEGINTGYREGCAGARERVPSRCNNRVLRVMILGDRVQSTELRHDSRITGIGSTENA
jgi:hypothetical protein